MEERKIGIFSMRIVIPWLLGLLVGSLLTWGSYVTLKAGKVDEHERRLNCLEAQMTVFHKLINDLRR